MSFHPENADWDKIKIGLLRYENIMKIFYTRDVSRDPDFQRAFNGFYKVRRRKPDFYETIYDFLESHKNNEITFEEILRYFFDKFGRLESSFSSKVLATINPNKPVWDSEVLKRLNLKTPSYNLNPETRFLKILETYDKICNWYDDFLRTDESKRMLNMFNSKNPNTNITDVKKIDLILWQSRSENFDI